MYININVYKVRNVYDNKIKDLYKQKELVWHNIYKERFIELCDLKNKSWEKKVKYLSDVKEGYDRNDLKYPLVADKKLSFGIILMFGMFTALMFYKFDILGMVCFIISILPIMLGVFAIKDYFCVNDEIQARLKNAQKMYEKEERKIKLDGERMKKDLDITGLINDLEREKEEALNQSEILRKQAYEDDIKKFGKCQHRDMMYVNFMDFTWMNKSHMHEMSIESRRNWFFYWMGTFDREHRTDVSGELLVCVKDNAMNQFKDSVYCKDVVKYSGYESRYGATVVTNWVEEAIRNAGVYECVICGDVPLEKQDEEVRRVIGRFWLDEKTL